MADAKINTKYKDRLFRLRFGSEEYKEDILSLYNALNGTSYDNTDDITITTIGDVIYIKMKNDVSFLLDGHIPLWEQQGSVNPNMPVRGLLYFGELYDQYIKVNELNIYGKKLQKIPTPQYVVFYNGTEVMSVCLTEFDEKVYTEGIREEGRNEGREEGRNEGREEGLKALVYSLKDFLPDFDSLYKAVVKNVEYANVSKEQVRKYY